MSDTAIEVRERLYRLAGTLEAFCDHLDDDRLRKLCDDGLGPIVLHLHRLAGDRTPPVVAYSDAYRETEARLRAVGRV